MTTNSTRTKFMEHIGSKEKKIRNISEFYAKNSLPLNATEQGIQNILKPSSDIAEGHVSKRRWYNRKNFCLILFLVNC